MDLPWEVQFIINSYIKLLFAMGLREDDHSYKWSVLLLLILIGWVVNQVKAAEDYGNGGQVNKPNPKFTDCVHACKKKYSACVKGNCPQTEMNNLIVCPRVCFQDSKRWFNPSSFYQQANEE